jgi:GntR family transcriptional regulator
MAGEWSDKLPIYLQIRDRLITSILEGEIAEGDAVPSVRNFAAEFQINPITVSKGYQELVDEGLVEKRRGLGMFVAEGAQARLRQRERERFLSDEWPEVLARAQRLGLDVRDLLRRSADDEEK